MCITVKNLRHHLTLEFLLLHADVICAAVTVHRRHSRMGHGARAATSHKHVYALSTHLYLHQVHCHLEVLPNAHGELLPALDRSWEYVRWKLDEQSFASNVEVWPRTQQKRTCEFLLCIA